MQVNDLKAASTSFLFSLNFLLFRQICVTSYGRITSEGYSHQPDVLIHGVYNSHHQQIRWIAGGTQQH
jgi:hypothetical protein